MKIETVKTCTIEIGEKWGLPNLSIFNSAHVPFRKHGNSGERLHASFTGNPNDNGKWLEVTLAETDKAGRTRTIAVCLSGESLAALRALVAKIPE